MSDAKGMSKHARGAATRVLMPVVATLASAVAGYLAKKGPQYLEQTVMPKLRETKQSGGDVAQDLADRARSTVGGDGGEEMSNDELERRRRERAEHRAERRRAS